MEYRSNYVNSFLKQTNMDPIHNVTLSQLQRPHTVTHLFIAHEHGNIDIPIMCYVLHEWLICHECHSAIYTSWHYVAFCCFVDLKAWTLPCNALLFSTLTNHRIKYQC